MSEGPVRCWRSVAGGAPKSIIMPNGCSQRAEPGGREFAALGRERVVDECNEWQATAQAGSGCSRRERRRRVSAGPWNLTGSQEERPSVWVGPWAKYEAVKLQANPPSTGTDGWVKRGAAVGQSAADGYMTGQ